MFKPILARFERDQTASYWGREFWAGECPGFSHSRSISNRTIQLTCMVWSDEYLVIGASKLDILRLVIQIWRLTSNMKFSALGNFFLIPKSLSRASQAVSEIGENGIHFYEIFWDTMAPWRTTILRAPSTLKTKRDRFSSQEISMFNHDEYF